MAVTLELVLSRHQGKYLWPGFGDNIRVLDWILRRCAGQDIADPSPVGLIPKPGERRSKKYHYTTEFEPDWPVLFRFDRPGGFGRARRLGPAVPATQGFLEHRSGRHRKVLHRPIQRGPARRNAARDTGPKEAHQSDGLTGFSIIGGSKIIQNS